MINHSDLRRDFEFDRDLGIWVPKGQKRSYKLYDELGFFLDSKHHIPGFIKYANIGFPIITKKVIKKKTTEKKVLAEPKEVDTDKEKKDFLFLDPRKIKAELDKYVISQEEAKKSMAVAFSKIYKQDMNNIINYQSSNYLLIGPTGVGKTKLLETLSGIFDMPIEIVKTAMLVQPGIVGDRIEKKFKNLKIKIDKKLGIYENNNPIVLQMGQYFRNNCLSIMYFDEIDKICSNGRYRSNIYGDALQDELISALDKTSISGVDTNKVLFIAGGSFENLDKIVLEKMNKSTNIGFGAEISAKRDNSIKDVYNNLSTDDLIKYGMKKELIGRFPGHAFLNSLEKDDLVRILTECEDSIIKSTSEFYRRTDDVDIIFSDESLELIADYSLASGTGARALQGAVGKVLGDYEYKIMEYRGKSINITGDVVRSSLRIK